MDKNKDGFIDVKEWNESIIEDSKSLFPPPPSPPSPPSLLLLLPLLLFLPFLPLLPLRSFFSSLSSYLLSFILLTQILVDSLQTIRETIKKNHIVSDDLLKKMGISREQGALNEVQIRNGIKKMMNHISEEGLNKAVSIILPKGQTSLLPVSKLLEIFECAEGRNWGLGLDLGSGLGLVGVGFELGLIF